MSSCVLFIDPVTGDEVCCEEDAQRSRADHWESVAVFLARLTSEDHAGAVEYAKLVLKASRVSK